MKERRFVEFDYDPEEDEIVLRLRSPFLRLIPEETRTHIMSARKETLLAFRSLLDVAIKKTEEREKPRSRRRTEIKVE